jgi:hypothetical protein
MTYSSNVGSGYINPCPSSHPFLEKYSTWDAYCG